jgi:hypothetical protein
MGLLLRGYPSAWIGPAYRSRIGDCRDEGTISFCEDPGVIDLTIRDRKRFSFFGSVWWWNRGRQAQNEPNDGHLGTTSLHCHRMGQRETAARGGCERTSAQRSGRQVKVAFPVGTVQVGTWSSSGTLTGNSGTYEYDFPSILSGFEVTVEAQHWEGTLDQAGSPTCAGEVTLTLEGTNPIGFIAGGLSVISIMGAYPAIRVRSPSAGGSKL